MTSTSAHPSSLSNLDGSLQSLIASWREGNGDAGRALIAELSDISSYIQGVRAEIASVSLEELQRIYIPSATDQLDAIVEMTAEATNRIMDVAESLQTAIDGTDSAVSEKLMDAATQIFEACAFQDITGQRVRKVVSALQRIEGKIEALMWAFSPDRKGGDLPRSPSPVEPVDKAAASLLEGPQLAASAKSQDEIDALFSQTA